MYLEVNKNDYIQGSVNAPIEIIEYADFQCPYCGKGYHIVKEIAGSYGKLWEMRDLLFEHQNGLDDYNLLEYAKKLGMSH